MGGLAVGRRGRPHPARLRLFAEGYTLQEFAEFHGCSVYWVSRVLQGKVPAPARFRADLARFLAVPEELLFPEVAR
jgi:transcriptional regulator with XRE-family HTH domain